MRKRSLILLVTIMIAFSFTACGNQKKVETTEKITEENIDNKVEESIDDVAEEITETPDLPEDEKEKSVNLLKDAGFKSETVNHLGIYIPGCLTVDTINSDEEIDDSDLIYILDMDDVETDDMEFVLKVSYSEIADMKFTKETLDFALDKFVTAEDKEYGISIDLYKETEKCYIYKITNNSNNLTKYNALVLIKDTSEWYLIKTYDITWRKEPITIHDYTNDTDKEFPGEIFKEETFNAFLNTLTYLN